VVKTVAIITAMTVAPQPHVASTRTSHAPSVKDFTRSKPGNVSAFLCNFLGRNTYAAVLGSASYAECPADAASPEQSDALTDCRCRLGFYGPNGGVCTECVENTYADTLGTEACADCAVHSEAPRRSDAHTDCVCSGLRSAPAPCVL